MDSISTLAEANLVYGNRKPRFHLGFFQIRYGFAITTLESVTLHVWKLIGLKSEIDIQVLKSGVLNHFLRLPNLVPRVFVPLDQRVGLRETLG